MTFNLATLVRRDPHPIDRRATLVSLTESGAAAAMQMVGERRTAAHTVFGGRPAADLAGFSSSLTTSCATSPPTNAPATSADPVTGS